MRWLLTLLIFLLSFQSVTYADNAPKVYIGNVGRAPFALMSESFPCDAFVKSIKNLPGWHIATLYNTFGTNYKCWDRLAKSPKLQTVELNLINEPGQRNGRLGNYEFLYSVGSMSNWQKLLEKKDSKLKKKFTSYTKTARRKIAALPPQVQCLINPGLESNLSDKAGSVLIQWTKELFPRCRVVWNPLSANDKKTSYAGADLVEGHGILPPVEPACLVNMDGTDVDFPERESVATARAIQSGNPLMQYIATYADKCEIVFVWTAEDNCNFSTSFKDPRKRDCSKSAKVFELSGKEVEKAMKKILVYSKTPWSPQEEKSLDSCEALSDPTDGRKKGFLLKQSESRSRGGVIILPIEFKPRQIDVLSNGKVIDQYTSAGKYTEDNSNRPLWRSNKSPINYPFHVVIRVRSDNKDFCFQIDDPQIRLD